MATMLLLAGPPPARHEPGYAQPRGALTRIDGAQMVKWLSQPKEEQGGQKQFRLPGVGTVRVNIDKHVDEALKNSNNEFRDRAGSAKQPQRKKI